MGAVIVGFCEVEVKPLGPVQAVGRAGDRRGGEDSGGPAVTGPLFSATGFAGIGLPVWETGVRQK